MASSFVNNASLQANYTVDPEEPIRSVTAVSNEAITDVVSVSYVKSVNTQYAAVGDTLHYTLTVQNNSTIPLAQAVARDTDIPTFLTVGNIMLNGVAVPSGQDLTTGVQIGSLAAAGTAIVTFDATVGVGATNTIQNTASLTFNYENEPRNETVTQNSNTVSVNLVAAELTLTKVVDKTVVTVNGDKVTYTLTVKNTGNADVTDVTVTDLIPAGMTYVPNSTVIGTMAPIDQSPASGINVGDMSAGDELPIMFSVYANF